MNPAASSWIYDVTEATFQKAVVDASEERPVIIDFWAPWCQPCRTLGPLLEKVVDEKKGKVALARINVDEAQRLAMQLGIESIPALRVVHKGQLIDGVDGLLPEAELRAMLDRITPGGEEDQAAQEAADAADPQAAEKRYRDQIAKNAENMKARVGLARALLLQERLDEAEQAVADVFAEGDLAAEVGRLTAEIAFRRQSQGMETRAALERKLAEKPGDAQLLLALGKRLAADGAYEDALVKLLAAGEADLKLASTEVRENMVKVFYALGPSHPLANEYRSRLAQLLY